MNSTLCSFPSRTIYRVGKVSFRPANDVVAAQCSYVSEKAASEFVLNGLSPERAIRIENAFVQALVGSEHSLSVVVLKGRAYSSKARFPQSPLIAGLVHYFYQLNRCRVSILFSGSVQLLIFV